MIILLHTSKTMRPAEKTKAMHPTPELLKKTSQLADYLKTLSENQIMTCMKVSSKLAEETKQKIDSFTSQPEWQRAAIDSFIGDIYSGLRVQTWTDADRNYAQKHLYILSGLYGVLRPLDGIYPYRLEMGYRLPNEPYRSLYKFWSNSIVDTLPITEPIVNLAAVEYSKTITPFVAPNRIITPQFLTTNPKTNVPTFVVVHAKIARGAFASWLIRNRIKDVSKLRNFNDLGYSFSTNLSNSSSPVFVCKEFEGLGLSVRLT